MNKVVGDGGTPSLWTILNEIRSLEEVVNEMIDWMELQTKRVTALQREMEKMNKTLNKRKKNK